MSQAPSHSSARESSRRTFLGQSSAVLLGSALSGGVLAARAGAGSRAHGDAPLRVALIGCGGRGTGAAVEALSTAGPVQLVAMADAFPERIEASLAQIARHAGAERIDVPEERRFAGFDAFRNALDSGIDVAILATPPGFRPLHFEYAVGMGAHVFMEKPVAVDAPGVRRVLAAGETARALGLKVGVGLQRRHEHKYQKTIERIHAGEIGELTLLRCYWNGSGVWVRPRQEGMSEMEYQMRNWYYFNWLCGDHIVEQHIHNLDACNWVMGGHPVSAQGQGGRQVRSGPDHGEIFDHHMVEYTYANGVKMLSQCRHIPGCWESVSEHVHGTLGTADLGAGMLRVKDGSTTRFRDENPNPYQLEHDRLFAAIREDLPHDEVEVGATSTLTAIMGRMATYSGKVVSWDAALASDLELAPASFAFDADPPTLPDEDGRYPIPVPGLTRAF